MDRLGVIVALEREAAYLGRPRPRPERITPLDAHCSVLLCGAGTERAQQAAARLIESGASCLLSFGTAGALSPHLAPGDLLVPETVYWKGAALPVDAGWRRSALEALRLAHASLNGGAMFCAEQVVSDPREKAEVFARTGAVAVDMESGAILQCAGVRRVPALVLRVALDPANLSLPHAVLAHCDAYGRPRALALLAGLLSEPKQVVPFLRLLQASAAAGRTLRWAGRRRTRLLPPACVPLSPGL